MGRHHSDWKGMRMEILSTVATGMRSGMVTQAVEGSCGGKPRLWSRLALPSEVVSAIELDITRLSRGHGYVGCQARRAMWLHTTGQAGSLGAGHVHTSWRVSTNQPALTWGRRLLGQAGGCAGRAAAQDKGGHTGTAPAQMTTRCTRQTEGKPPGAAHVTTMQTLAAEGPPRQCTGVGRLSRAAARAVSLWLGRVLPHLLPIQLHRQALRCTPGKTSTLGRRGGRCLGSARPRKTGLS